MKFSLSDLKSTFSKMKAISSEENSNKYRPAQLFWNRAKQQYFDTEAIEKIIKD